MQKPYLVGFRMNDKSNDCPVCLKEMEKHTAHDLCACMMKIIKGKPSNYVSPDSAKTEMFEKLNKDLRLKIQNAVRIIDRRIEEYQILGTNLTAEQYDSQYFQIARIIQDYKLIKSKLIPEEKST